MRGSAALPFPPGVRGRTVVVGVSGGVDSAVCAALLQEAGAQVVPVWLCLFDGSSHEDAAALANCLGLALHKKDCRVLFHNRVVEPFISAYCHCRTPSPCCECNPEVKFRALCDVAASIGADWIATGHYAQLQQTDAGPLLRAAVDAQRDQSYFLYRLSLEQRKHLVFPLGCVLKKQVRAYANERQLPTAHKTDSQDICFLAASGLPYGDFIASQLRARGGALPSALQPGPIIGPMGRVLGEHHGTLHYTIGQRHGLGVAADAPLYVTQLEERKVHVGYRAATGVCAADLEDFCWSLAPLGAPGVALGVLCQFRSTMRPEPAELFIPESGAAWRIRWPTLQYGVAPGQAAVLRNSRGDIVGGGVITATAPAGLDATSP